MTKFSADILKKHNYYPPSFYLKKSDDTTKDIINDVNANLLYLGESIKNNAVFEEDPSGYTLARPKKKNPSKKTLDLLSEYNVLSTYSKNLNDVRRYKEKSGSGMIDPQQLIDRLELLGESILGARLLNQKTIKNTPLKRTRLFNQ